MVARKNAHVKKNANVVKTAHAEKTANALKIINVMKTAHAEIMNTKTAREEKIALVMKKMEL